MFTRFFLWGSFLDDTHLYRSREIARIVSQMSAPHMKRVRTQRKKDLLYHRDVQYFFHCKAIVPKRTDRKGVPSGGILSLGFCAAIISGFM